MTASGFNAKHVALLLLSASLLAIQVTLLQVLATSQWHHFAYLVISIALLGFGAAGTILSLCRKWMLTRQQVLLPLFLCACAVTLAGALRFVSSHFGGFDSFLLFVNPGETIRLGISALILMLPFIFGALVIGLIFTIETGRIGSYYFANMMGSGMGCIIGLAGLSLFDPGLLPPWYGFIVLLGALPLLRGTPITVKVTAVLSMGCVLVFALTPTVTILSPYKDLRKSLDLPGAKVIVDKPSTFGQIQIVTSPVMRSAAGLSLRWRKEIQPSAGVFVNGNMLGSMPLLTGQDNPYQATTMALPFAINAPDEVLVLNAGTGQEVAFAHETLAKMITAVEPHRQLIAALSQVANESQQVLFSSSHIRWDSIASRTWLARDTGRYELIQLPMVGSFGGNSGLFALSEQPLLTVEALEQAWRLLASNGFMSLTCWIDYPVRSPLRLLATLVEVLEGLGKNPADHIVAIRSWGTLTFCIKKTPLTSDDITAVKAFMEDWSFDALMPPGVDSLNRDPANRLQDDSLVKLLNEVLNPELRTELYRNYPFQIRPTNDNRPFFSQFLRWSQIDYLIEQYGRRTVPFLELGLLVAGLAAVTLSLLAVILILLPLIRLPMGQGSRWKTLLYFGGLGIGYIWTEMALIHRFEFYIGQPVYSASLVVAVLLTSSALGSMLTERCRGDNATRIIISIFGFLLFYSLVLSPLLQITIQFPLPARIGVAILVLVPAAVFMGMPFPLGLRALNQSRPAEIPWAWGINGCLSVVGAAISTLVAVEAGYSVLLLLAACSYLLPLFSRLKTA